MAIAASSRSYDYYDFYFLTTLMCAILLMIMTMVPPASCQRRNYHVPMFIFGDSLFDVGNNNYLKNAVGRANFWPYGETFFNHPTGRFSDGRLIPDFIGNYLNLPLIPPYLQPGGQNFANGANFASGGAGALVETHQGQVIDLKTQLTYFKDVKKQLRKKLGDDAEVKTLVSRAVYLFSVGGNDYIAPFTTNSSIYPSFSKKHYVGMVIGNLTTVLKQVYENGGRKFAFASLGPLGCLPTIKALKQDGKGGCLDEVTLLVKLHNEALTKALKELQRELKGFNYSDFDFYTTLSKRINNPSKYGFKEAEAACCGSGQYRGVLNCGGMTAVKQYLLCDNAKEYLFFDGSHPNEKAYNQLANLMWSGSSSVMRPCNLKTLITTSEGVFCN